MIDEDRELPDGWKLSTLGASATLVNTKVDPRQIPGVPYVGLEHVEAQTMRLLGHGTASEVRSNKSEFSSGDVLYGKLRPYLNKVARPDFDGVCSTDFLVFTESPELDRGYLANYLNQMWVADRAHHLSNGVELPRVDWRSLSQLPIAYPVSKAQQRIIVRRIDAVRQAESATTSHLASARSAIERFRQAVLAAACAGNLTMDWRQRHPEAPTVEAALANLKSNGGRRAAAEPDCDLPLPEVPESYVISTLGCTAIVLEYGSSQRADSLRHGVPMLRMGNIQDGRLVLKELKYCTANAEIERLMLEDGDLVFNRTNSPELVGKSAVFHEATPMTFASYLIRVRFAPDIADPDFVNFWINSAWGRVWARQVKTDGVSQSNINGTKLAAMPVPLPPIEEQREIVRRGRKMLQVADGLIERIDAAARHVERTSQAVLVRAFRGELGTGNGTDHGAVCVDAAT